MRLAGGIKFGKVHCTARASTHLNTGGSMYTRYIKTGDAKMIRGLRPDKHLCYIVASKSEVS